MKIYRAGAVVLASKLSIPLSRETVRQLTDEGQKQLWERLTRELQSGASNRSALGQAVDLEA